MCTHLCKQINARDQSGQTALHRSAQQGLVNVCQFLLQHGADASLVTRDGHTVADMANVSVLKLLQGVLCVCLCACMRVCVCVCVYAHVCVY